MRRWNGWGDDQENYPAPSSAARLLDRLVGKGTPPRDAGFEQVLAAVPPSRLPAHPLATVEKADRLRHARGQSLPDWVDLRSGRVSSFPDGVAYPAAEGDVLELIRFAQEADVKVIPYGGGTSVLGHINPVEGEAPVLTVDMSRLRGMRRLEATDRLAVFGAGTTGPGLEVELNRKGFTLGHFPQSFELSTLGGWVATRSSGQESLGYGRIERLFAGGRLASPSGVLQLPSFPASAAGPDLREMVLGSEGRMGIFTEIAVRVTPLAEREAFHAFFFPDFSRGGEAAREMVQAGLPLSMLRLSNAAETFTTLALAGSRLLIAGFERVLSLRGVKGDKCLMLLGIKGKDPLFRTVKKEALGLARRHKGVHAGRAFGKQWRKNRFRAPYLRNTLWEAGYAVDTLETAVPWTKVPETVEAVESALQSGLGQEGERVHAFTHLSHLYPCGSSIYVTYIFRLAKEPEETKRRWRRLKKAASEAVVRSGGTISHHHGVGEDHLPYLEAEKGAVGIEAIQDLCLAFDPKGVMNPGKLVWKRGDAIEEV